MNHDSYMFIYMKNNSTELLVRLANKAIEIVLGKLLESNKLSNLAELHLSQLNYSHPANTKPKAIDSRLPASTFNYRNLKFYRIP